MYLYRERSGRALYILFPQCGDATGLKLLPSQFRALGKAGLPETVEVDGRQYRLEETFKHTFASAVGLYRCDEDRIVCKFHRRASFFGVPLAWYGWLAAAYESAALRSVQGVPGVPALRGKPSRTAVARDFIGGRPLDRHMKVSDEFFPLLMELLAGIHARGVAYVDLEKPENILVGDDGRPYLIDFQVAFNVPPRFLGQTTLARLVRRRLQQSDDYHAMKHFRRVRPDLLTEDQIARSRVKPWPVRAGNLLVAPWKKFRRRAIGK
jgi:hypothetical protein